MVKAYLVLILVLAGCASSRLSSRFPSSSGGSYYATNLAFGPSVPANDPASNITPDNTMSGYGAPTRASGGKTFRISFRDARNLPATRSAYEIILFAYSKSGKGQVLVHSASLEAPSGNTPLTALSSYADLDPGSRAHQSGENVLLANGDMAGVHLPGGAADIGALDLTLEAFGSDDASVAVQAIFNGVPAEGARINVQDQPTPSGGIAVHPSLPGAATGAGSCRQDGMSCRSGSECCSRECGIGNVCGNARSCHQDGAPCTAGGGALCCSHMCGPGNVCGNIGSCRKAGAPCTAGDGAAVCCSHTCGFGNVCQ